VKKEREKVKREGEERASFVGGSRALFFVVLFLGWFFFFRRARDGHLVF
jgi:hypothetical protein